MKLAPTKDLLVEVTGTIRLYPVGTLHSGGTAPHRPADAPDVGTVPVRGVDAFIAELGDKGDALAWARKRVLARFGTPERVARDPEAGGPLDVLSWAVGVDVEQWREFARLYGLATDGQGKLPGLSPLDRDDCDAWYVRHQGMNWNVDGVTTGHDAELTVRLWPAACVHDLGGNLMCASPYIVRTYPAERGWPPQPYCAIHAPACADDEHPDSD